MKNSLLVAMLCIFSLLPLSGQTVDIKIQIQFLPHILSFDRNQLRFGDPINIGVSSESSVDVFNKLLSQTDVNGKKIICTKMSSIDDLKNHKVVFIDDNWSKDFSKIIEIAKTNQILVICRKEEFLEQGGAVSFRKLINKAQIVVHQENSKAVGSNFMANFLKAIIVI